MRIIGRPNSSRVFGLPPASSMARRTGAEECAVLHNTLCDSEQHGLTAKIPSSGLLLGLHLAAMFLAFLHVHVKSDDEEHHAAQR